MTTPSNQTNEEIAQGIAEFNLQADCACDISKCHVCQLKDDIKEALDSRDSLHQEQLGDKDARIRILEARIIMQDGVRNVLDENENIQEQLGEKEKEIQRLKEKYEPKLPGNPDKGYGGVVPC